MTATTLDSPATGRPTGEPVLDVRQLAVRFETAAGTAHAVRDVSFSLGQGETLGLLGESGSGKTAVARFTRTLGTLIAAGVPILDALTITRETCGNEVYARAINKVHDAIREGESMAAPLKATKVVDTIVVNMVDVGEETGDLDKMLMKVADNYDSDVDVLVGSLISILEPVMVVVLGLIVGFIVIALFAPMISLIQAVSGPGGKK